MESIWNTVATIIATGLVIYGGYFLRDIFARQKRGWKAKAGKRA